MGFSFLGTLLAIAIALPNLLLLRYPPRQIPPGMSDLHIAFSILEWIGRIGCLAVLALSKSRLVNRPFDIWFALAAACYVLSLVLWARYVASGHHHASLYESVGGVPIPMAILPVCTFAFLAIWSESMRLSIVTALFAMGTLPKQWHIFRNYVR